MAIDWFTQHAPPNADPSQFNRYGGTYTPGVGPPPAGTTVEDFQPGGRFYHTGGVVGPGSSLPGSSVPGVAPPGSALPQVGKSAQDDFGGPQNGDYQGWFNKLVAGKPYNQQTLLDLEPTLNKYGIQLTPPNASGERTKINIPGQGWTRVGFGEGKPVWIPQGAGGGGGGAGGGGAGFNPSMAGGIQPYQSPNFTPPTDITMQNDPGYKARMALGQEAIEGSAAARGGILSGGTLKALDRYAQDYASNEYGNVFNRAAQTSGINAGIGQLGYQNRYGQYQDWQNWNQQNANRGQQAGNSLYRPPPQ